MVVACLFAACGHGSASVREPGAGDRGVATHAAFPEDEDTVRPAYDRDALERALAAEQAAVAAGEHSVGELGADAGGDGDALRAAIADLAVRRRFLAMLVACRDAGRRCPPRLDDPPWSYDVEGTAAPKLDTALRFDLEDWRKVAAELHGRACACRTLACVDSMTVAIGELEKRPMPDVEGDETASTSITRARECLFGLRGETR
jgi:hypothetical protein